MTHLTFYTALSEPEPKPQLAMRSPLLVLFLLLALTLPLAAQQNFDEVQIETIPVADGIYMLVGAGGNIGVSVGEDGVFLIDDQYAPLTRKIRAAVALVSDQPIRFVLNTHYHGDHVGGNERMGEIGALIVAHDNVYERMSTEQFMSRFSRTVPPSPKAALPVISFSDDVTFHVNGDDIHAIHVPPAHTDGDAVVAFPGANVLHMGDVFFNGIYPFIDLDAGGDVNGMINAVGMALEMMDDETRIIPGHGPLGDKAALEAYHNMLQGVRGAIQTLIDEGKSLDDVKAAAPTAPWDDPWGAGFMNAETFTEIVYQSLSR